MWMQADNNLVEYDNPANTALWMTNSNGKSADPGSLIMQDDGELVISAGGKIIWSNKWGSMLRNGETMADDTCIKSSDQVYKACLQTDGNFCVYQNTLGVWCSYSHGKGSRPRRIIMQTDNNLVEYDAANVGLWMTKTNGKSNELANLVMQNDGNLIIYAGRNALWSTKPYPPTTSSTFGPDQVMFEDECIYSPNKVYKFCIQSDGNLCTFKNGAGDWCSYSHGKGTRPRRLVMSADNNLIEYDATHAMIWQTGTNGKGNGAAALRMQDDGNLVLFVGGEVLWKIK